MIEETLEFSSAVNSNERMVCITTNGELTTNGKAIMGAGVALVARKLFDNIDRLQWQALYKYGNVPSKLGYYSPSHGFDVNRESSLHQIEIWSFPVKGLVSDPADIRLIVQSAKLLDWEIKNSPMRSGKVFIPRPGCGVGGLRWNDVRPYLKDILSNNFYTIIDKP
jgi:hypothetical protein